MKGHTEDVCRQHLLCNRCDRRGHLAEDCYAAKPKRPTLNNMVLTRNDRLPRWPVKVNGVILHAILDSGAEHSVMSQATVERLGIQVNKSNEAIETKIFDLLGKYHETYQDSFAEANTEGEEELEALSGEM